MNATDRAVWVGWTTRMLLLAVGGFFVAAGYSEEQVTTWLSGTAELLVGAATVGLTMLWSWWRTRQDKQAAQRVGVIAVLLVGLLALPGCLSQQDLADLRQSIDDTRQAIEAQEPTEETERVVAVLDRAEQAVDRIPVIDDGADIGQVVQSFAPLAGPYAPWVTLIGGLLAGVGGALASKRREDRAFDEGVARGGSGEVKPAESDRDG